MLANTLSTLAVLLLTGVSAMPTPAGPAPSVQASCAAVTAVSPTVADCVAAIKKITPGAPGACIAMIIEETAFSTVGSCTIQTFSSRGRAHCLNRDEIIAAATNIVQQCQSGQKTGGEITWVFDPSTPTGEGVRLITAA